MTRSWRRRRAGWRDNLGAALAGVGAGLAAFYLVRILLSRDEVTPPQRAGGDRRTEDGREGP